MRSLFRLLFGPQARELTMLRGQVEDLQRQLDIAHVRITELQRLRNFYAEGLRLATGVRVERRPS